MAQAQAESKFSKQIKNIPPGEIIVPPDRQRSGGALMDTTDLEPSIRARGIMNPIVVKKDPKNELVAGERRLRAALKLGLALVPIRYFEDLDPIEAQIVELEENERRKALDWRDHAKAIAKIHSLYELQALGRKEEWNVKRTCEMLFYDPGHMSRILRVARDIDSPKIANAPSLSGAFNTLDRLDQRAIGDAMSSILDAGRVIASPKAEPEKPAAEGALVLRPPAVQAPPPQPESILNVSFLDWAPAYSGPKFSFVHCDFPYGVDVFGGSQANTTGGQQGYDDNPDVYWQLIRSFCAHRDRFMAQSAHMMFWFDMDFYEDTLALFAELAPEIVFLRKPLIWTKTCNTGILSDPKRRPRHIYETCLIAARGDRYIIRATSDSYGCHMDKDYHPSTKPEPMLRNFFQMFVDEHSSVLDPTCGGGSSIRAAESLGAGHVLGLEINPEHCEAARSALRQSRTKAALAKIQKAKAGGKP